MSAHTPGPWLMVRTGYTGRASSKFVINPIGSSRSVAHVKHSTKSPMEANARLIAAAPNLLKTLQEMDCWLDNTGHAADHPWRISLRAAIDSATQPAALATDTGEKL